MTPDPSRVTDFLEHILSAIERVREYTRNLSEQDFCSNRLIQDAVIRNFEIMGEAARNVERHGETLLVLKEKLRLFRQVYWMRNMLTHEYFHVSLPIVWNAIRTDLDVLEQQVQKLYEELNK